MELIDKIIYGLGLIASIVLAGTCLWVLLYVPHNQDGDWVLSMWGIIAAIAAMICVHRLSGHN